MRAFLDKFFHSNDWLWRLARTIFQGILAVIVKSLGQGGFELTDLSIPIIMAIASPVMAEMGNSSISKEDTK